MKSRLRKVIALICTGALVLALTACGSSSDSSSSDSTDAAEETEAEAEETEEAEEEITVTEEDGSVSNTAVTGESVQREVINVGINADPGDLSPFGPQNTGRTAMASTIWESLAHVIDGEIVGVLMKDYELAEDESYMDVTIYDYIYDTDGNHMTADDVVFSFYKCVEIGNVNGLGFIETAEAIDDYTVRFTFNDVLYVYDIETLFENVYICTEAAYEASSDGMATSPVSTAPYKVTEYTAGYSIVCEKNENYWQTDESLINDRDQANVNTINYYILTESTQMTLALQNGSIDMSWSVSNDDIGDFEDSDDYWVYQDSDNLVSMLYLNCDEDHATADENLRKAIYYCVNAEVILESVYGGNGVLCYDTAAPKAPDYLDKWQEEDNYYHYSLEKAQEYLDAWGGDPSTLNLTILAASDATITAIAEMWQGFMSQIGITSNILAVDSATIGTYINDPTQWDCVVASKATANYVTTSWRNCFSASYFSWGGSINFVYDDEFQELLDAARLLATHNDETVDAVHQYIVEHAYGYGVVNVVDNYVVPNYVSSVVRGYKGEIMPGACTYTES